MTTKDQFSEEQERLKKIKNVKQEIAQLAIQFSKTNIGYSAACQNIYDRLEELENHVNAGASFRLSVVPNINVRSVSENQKSF